MTNRTGIPKLFYTPCDPHQAGALHYTNLLYQQIDPTSRFLTTSKMSKMRRKWMKEQEQLHGKSNLTCSICGKKHLDPWVGDQGGRQRLATLDHVLPVSHYPHLWNIPSNFQVACYSCNTKKSNRY